MYSFEKYLLDANQARSPQQLFSTFKKALAEFGYDKILFGLLTDHKDIDLTAGVGVIENYPPDWMKYYFEHSFDKIDPIITYGAQQSVAFAWGDIPKQVKLTKIQRTCLNMGVEAGLNNGLSVPLRGPNHQLAGISLASSEKMDACHFDVDLLTAYCNHFYTAYKRLHKRTSLNPENILLTDKERAVLTLAARGRTEAEIADDLIMTTHNVHMYFRRISQKLDARGKTLCVVKAITSGIIHI